MLQLKFNSHFVNRLQEVSELGKQLMSRNPGLTELNERLGRLDTEYTAVKRGYDEKGAWLRQCLDLQMLNKEADNIDTITSSHEAFLEFTDLGVGLLMKVPYSNYNSFFLSTCLSNVGHIHNMC